MQPARTPPLYLVNVIVILIIGLVTITSPNWITGFSSPFLPIFELFVGVYLFFSGMVLFVFGGYFLKNITLLYLLSISGYAFLSVLSSNQPNDPFFLYSMAFLFTNIAAVFWSRKDPENTITVLGFIFPVLSLIQLFNLYQGSISDLLYHKPLLATLYVLALIINFFALLTRKRQAQSRPFGWLFLAGTYLFQAVIYSMDSRTWPEMTLLVFVAAIFLLNNRSSFPTTVLFQFEKDEKRLSSILLISFLIVSFGLKIYNLQPETAFQLLAESSRPITISAMSWIGLSSISIAALITLILSQRAKLEAIQEILSPPTDNPQDTPLSENIIKQIDQIQKSLSSFQLRNRHLTKQLADLSITEKQLRLKLLSLISVTQQLDPSLDPPVTAQITANLLQKSLGCQLVIVLFFSTEENRFFPIASAGTNATSIPNGFRMKAREGILARALKLKKATLINAYTGSNSEPLMIGDVSYKSILAIPMISNGNNDGMIVMADQKEHNFTPDDITLAEGTAERLLSAWRRSRTDQSLEEMIHAGISLTTLSEIPAILSRVAEVGSEVLKSHFVFITVRYKNHLEYGHSGKYKELLEYLIQPDNPLISETFQTMATIRVRDISRDPRLSEMLPLAGRFRSLMMAPILLHGEPIGSILTFGKKNGLIFEERDLFLVNILANQASGAVESSMLNEDIRLNLRNIQLLYNLSTQIDSAQQLDQAANVILEAAVQLTKAQSAGIMLFSPQRELEANLIIGKEKRNHPFSMIQQVMESQQAVFLSPSQDISIACFPLQTQRRCFGALWLEIEEKITRQAGHSTEELRILINQATVALERTILLAETKKQADEIARAYQELEEIYDQTLITLMSALDARDHETEGHCARVTNLATSLGEKMNLSLTESKALERGALLHDIGKIGISDSILHKPGPLSRTEWVEMQKHPVIGAKILEAIPFLRDAIPVVAGHQERWDGSGYPLGLSEKQIPIIARIFAVADVFDALISDRPYHQKRSPHHALEYMKEQSGTSFDPDVVMCLDTLMADPDFLLRNGYTDDDES